MKELEKAGVVSDEEAQSTKVREMSDEDFTSYKGELVSIRKAVIAELSKAGDGETEEEKAAREKQEQKDADKAAADKAAADKAAAEAAAAEEGGTQTPPANIDPGTAISAALNLEIFPPKEMSEKYDEMGKAMAKLFEEKTD